MRTVCSDALPRIDDQAAPLTAARSRPRSPRPRRRRRRPRAPGGRRRSRGLAERRERDPRHRARRPSPRAGAGRRRAGADATVALHDLAAAYPELAGAERARGERACWPGPPTAPPTRFGDGYPAGGADRERREPALLRLLGRRRRDSRTRPTSPTRTGSPTATASPTTSSRCSGSPSTRTRIEVAPGPLGWAPPKPDKAGCGARPGAHADIYLKQLGDDGLFGYQTVDPGQGRQAQPVRLPGARQRLRRRRSSATTTRRSRQRHLRARVQPPAPVRTTTPSRTSGCSSRPRPGPRRRSTRRSTTTSATSTPSRGSPATRSPSAIPPQKLESLRIYGAAVWNHWLDSGGGGFGSDAIRRAWELSDRDRPGRLRARRLRQGDRPAGRQGLQPRVRPVRGERPPSGGPGAGGFPDHAQYPDVKRKGSLSKGGRKSFEPRPHRLPPHARSKPSGGDKLRLRVDADDGVRRGSRWSAATATRSPAR